MAVAAMAGSSVDFVCSDIESSHHIAVNTEQNPEISFNNDRTDRMSSDSGQTPDRRQMMCVPREGWKGSSLNVCHLARTDSFCSDLSA
jgi:hypothetical protein